MVLVCLGLPVCRRPELAEGRHRPHHQRDRRLGFHGIPERAQQAVRKEAREPCMERFLHLSRDYIVFSYLSSGCTETVEFT